MHDGDRRLGREDQHAARLVGLVVIAWWAPSGPSGRRRGRPGSARARRRGRAAWAGPRPRPPTPRSPPRSGRATSARRAEARRGCRREAARRACLPAATRRWRKPSRSFVASHSCSPKRLKTSIGFILRRSPAAEMEEDGAAQGGSKEATEMAVLMTLEVPGGTDRQVRPRERDPRHRRRARRAARARHPRLRRHRRRHPRRRRLGLDHVARRLRPQPPRRGAARRRGCPTQCRTRRRCTTCSSARQGVERARADRHGRVHGRGLRRDHRGDAGPHRQRREHPAVMHVAALEPDGHIRVADLWDSEAAFGEFAADPDRPGLRRLMPPIVPRIVPVYNRLHARRARRPDLSGGRRRRRRRTRERPRDVRRARDRRVQRVGEPRRGRRRPPSAAAGP